MLHTSRSKSVIGVCTIGSTCSTGGGRRPGSIMEEVPLGDMTTMSSELADLLQSVSATQLRRRRETGEGSRAGCGEEDCSRAGCPRGDCSRLGCGELPEASCSVTALCDGTGLLALLGV